MKEMPDLRPIRKSDGSIRMRSRMATAHAERMRLRRAEQSARMPAYIIPHGFKPQRQVRSHVVKTGRRTEDGKIVDYHFTKGYRVRRDY